MVYRSLHRKPTYTRSSVLRRDYLPHKTAVASVKGNLFYRYLYSYACSSNGASYTNSWLNYLIICATQTLQ